MTHRRGNAGRYSAVSASASEPGPAQPECQRRSTAYAIRKSFQELLWKCKGIYFKKIKIIAEPVAAALAMAAGGPAAGQRPA